MTCIENTFRKFFTPAKNIPHVSVILHGNCKILLSNYVHISSKALLSRSAWVSPHQ